ncbi:hypothetical protein HWI79_1987 [Cryptosporidium felis]|nr:hypothetical protein HWI79_1987 [Cryptosporidium felis]
MHNRYNTGNYCHYDCNRTSEHYKRFGDNLLSQNNLQYGGSVYNKGLSAQGPNFLHNTKMSLSTVKLDVSNNAPALMNSLIEKNKEIKNLEKELKIVNESNIFLNNKIEMLKILAANFGATPENIETTMSANDVFCIPKPPINSNYPQTDSSCENLRENIEEELKHLVISDSNIVNLKSGEFSDYCGKQSSTYNLSEETTGEKLNQDSYEKRSDLGPKSFPKRSSTLLKSTKSLTNSLQAQRNTTNKYLTGTRFGPSVRQRAVMEGSANRKVLSKAQKISN